MLHLFCCDAQKALDILVHEPKIAVVAMHKVVEVDGPKRLTVSGMKSASSQVLPRSALRCKRLHRFEKAALQQAALMQYAALKNKNQVRCSKHPQIRVTKHPPICH